MQAPAAARREESVLFRRWNATAKRTKNGPPKARLLRPVLTGSIEMNSNAPFLGRALLGTLATLLAVAFAACAGSDKAEPASRDPSVQPISVPDQLAVSVAAANDVAQVGTVAEAAQADFQKVPQVSDAAATATPASYTYNDGDRTLTVFLDSDLTVGEDSGGTTDGDAITTRSSDPQRRGNELPVFRTSSGSLMTLPGGVLLLLNEGWTSAQVDTFFSTNEINRATVSELGWIDNGFFIETDPGFPSLNLANKLAGQEGVELSSPNWSHEVELR